METPQISDDEREERWQQILDTPMAEGFPDDIRQLPPDEGFLQMTQLVVSAAGSSEQLRDTTYELTALELFLGGYSLQMLARLFGHDAIKQLSPGERQAEHPARQQ